MATRRPARTCIVVATVTAALIHGAAAAVAGSVDPGLEAALAASPVEPVAVIVYLSSPTPDPELPPRRHARLDGEGRRGLLESLHRRAERSRRRIDTVLARRGIAPPVELWAVNAVALTADPAAIRELADLPGVDSIRADRVLAAVPTVVGSAAPDEWNLAMVRADVLWQQGFTGQGVTIAILDTGVDADHQDLASRFAGGPGAWFDPHGQHDAPTDRDGHGTRATGLVVGGSASGAAIGVAPGARWIAAKIFDDSGHAALSDIHEVLQWVLDPDGDPATDDAPQVANGSWGFPELVGECYSEFAADLELLDAAGVLTVFSAGNQGPAAATSVSPANNPAALAVGGVDELLRVETFSSRGPSACGDVIYPHVTAPSRNVRTADLTAGGVFTASYASVSGTSFAAPQVAGAAALLAGAFPDATPADLRRAIESGAADLGDPGPDNDSGYGLLDVAGAFRALARELGTPPRPAVRHVVGRASSTTPGSTALGNNPGRGERP